MNKILMTVFRCQRKNTIVSLIWRKLGLVSIKCIEFHRLNNEQQFAFIVKDNSPGFPSSLSFERLFNKQNDFNR